MGKLKFCVVNGPAASGRTTASAEIARELGKRGLKAVVMVNEEGLDSIAGRILGERGVRYVTMLGGCIGSQSDNLVAELRRLRDQEGVDIVIAEMPSVCACSPDHVYAPLRKKCKGEFDLAPLTSILTGHQVLAIADEAQSSSDGVPIPINYLHAKHLESGDILVVNKADLLADDQVGRCVGYVEQEYPGKPVLAGTVLDEAFIGKVVDLILGNEAGFHFISKGLDKKLYDAAEALFATYSQRICLISRDGEPIDFERFGQEAIEGMRKAAEAAGGQMAYATLLAEYPSKTVKDAGLMRVSRDSGEVERPFTLKEPRESLRVAMQVRHSGDSQVMLRTMMPLVDELAEKHGCKIEVFLVESFMVPDYTSRHYALLKRNDHDKFND